VLAEARSPEQLRTPRRATRGDVKPMEVDADV
jgi:hypothetical protein